MYFKETEIWADGGKTTGFSTNFASRRYSGGSGAVNAQKTGPKTVACTYWFFWFEEIASHLYCRATCLTTYPVHTRARLKLGDFDFNAFRFYVGTFNFHIYLCFVLWLQVTSRCEIWPISLNDSRRLWVFVFGIGPLVACIYFFLRAGWWRIRRLYN